LDQGVQVQEPDLEIRLPVAIAPPSPSVSDASMIEVVLANGRVLRIGADIDMTALKRIAAALEDEA
jgi:hypothetical protein